MIVTGGRGEDLPSPQSMVALYSAAVLIGSGSWKLATVWAANGRPSVALKVTPVAVMAASAAAGNPVIFVTKTSQHPPLALVVWKAPGVVGKLVDSV